MTTAEPVFMPKDPEEAERWEHTRKRVRMFTGYGWERDLLEHLKTQLNATGLTNLGRPAQAIRLMPSTVHQLACTYDREPTIEYADEVPEGAQDGLTQLVNEAKFNQIAQRNNEYVIALNDNYVYVGWSPRKQRVVLRIVTPDCVVVKTAPTDASVILELREARVRTVGTKRQTFWDVWSVEDGGSFRILDGDDNDVTSQFPDVEVPKTWPYVDEGEPYIPWVVYHARDTGQAHDPYHWSELVEATNDVAVLWSLFFHCCRDASWSQKGVVDLELDGLTTIQSGGQTAGQIDTRPTSILKFRSVGDKNGTFGAFPAPMEPTKFAEAVLQYQRTAVSNIGINPADLERTEAAQSGYAIQLKRTAQRRMAARFEPQLREGDLELLRKMVLVRNAFGTGEKLPVDGITIRYNPIDISHDEREQEFAYDQGLMEAGLLDKIAWYRKLNPGTDDEQATMQLLRVAAINKAIETGGMVVSPDTADRIVNARGIIESALVSLNNGGRISEEQFAAMLAKVLEQLTVGLDEAPEQRGANRAPVEDEQTEDAPEPRA